MENRITVHGVLYAILIFVIFGVCCLGIYVAVSGYQMSNPSSVKSDLSRTPAAPLTQIVIVISTDTPAPTKPGAIATLAPTGIPFPTAIGVFQTITTSATLNISFSTITPRAVLPTATAPARTALSIPPCGDFPFCANGGLPDASLAPAGIDCPRNYIWGRVLDAGGRGIPDRRVRFKHPDGSADSVVTKAAPDPPGIYNIPTGQPGGTWTVWLSDGGSGQASPQVVITTLVYPGSGNCTTRIDFAQKK